MLRRARSAASRRAWSIIETASAGSSPPAGRPTATRSSHSSQRWNSRARRAASSRLPSESRPSSSWLSSPSRVSSSLRVKSTASWIRSSRVWFRNAALAAASRSWPCSASSHSGRSGDADAADRPDAAGSDLAQRPARAAHAPAVLVAAPAVAEAHRAVSVDRGGEALARVDVEEAAVALPRQTEATGPAVALRARRGGAPRTWPRGQVVAVLLGWLGGQVVAAAGLAGGRCAAWAGLGARWSLCAWAGLGARLLGWRRRRRGGGPRGPARPRPRKATPRPRLRARRRASDGASDGARLSRSRRRAGRTARRSGDRRARLGSLGRMRIIQPAS
jgi:hypothetical protein